MKSPIPDYLIGVLDKASQINDGNPASYIEVLARADTTKSAVALATVDGSLYTAGDDRVEFSIQSISKAFVYALAIYDRGLDGVLAKIGVEPSGSPFNEFSIEKGRGHRPLNPLINLGAIMAHSLVKGNSPEERVERIRAILSKLAGRQLHVDESVYEAEIQTAYRNMGLAFMLKAAGVLECDPEHAVQGYVRQCAINVNVRDLAMMAATLANGGTHPVSGESIIPSDSVRQVLSVMTTCGMYDAAGDWVSNVGIPAKSGVSGGIIGALPGQIGLATFSPKVDNHGNSVRGVAMCQQLSTDLGLHMMDINQIARATVRQCLTTITTGEGPVGVPIFDLRGAVRFGGAELLTRTVARELSEPSEEPGSGCNADCPVVIFSLRETISLNTVAQAILRENIRRLRLDGKRVDLIDPNGVLDITQLLPEDQPTVFNSVEQALKRIGGLGYRVVTEYHS
ncbi:related to glutaminase, kidney isoform, mitochondrial precursor [Cephalotrichum gorgonifer]|uniref:glutaminase n=1 Tax=Cephalotrichum gorgonifer TaxID=2041049 RepID=A0AAE8T0B3_9PEZI|nr:related to glutaminase, kidney isoform, mitochondrial precursor [Cephalotrichum gorgonifer]